MRAPKQVVVVILAMGLFTSSRSMAGDLPGTPREAVGTRDPEALFTEWRWIGIMRADRRTCPTPTQDDVWTTQPLFPVEPPPDTGEPPKGALPGVPALFQFCVYETMQGNPKQPQFADGSAPIRLDRDFMGLMPAGGKIEQAYASALTSHFSSQAGEVDLPRVDSNPMVRLAIVDTAATREIDADDHHGTSDHGFTLLNLARNLLCDAAGNCVAKVTSRLALGWKCFDREGLDPACRDGQHGGLYGLPGEMARAINEEVRQWQAVDPDKKLVINLSVGWEPVNDPLEPVATMPVPALAVYTAIQHAVCEGAVVIAAAGNRTGGPTPEVGPILPAAWEERAAPGLVYCRAIGATPDSADFPLLLPLGLVPYRPLIHAVGGVRAGDGPLFNSRTAGEPRLVAFGDHAKGETSGAPGSGFTDTLTGTSMAAVVVSASAAAVWYYQGGLKPYQVLNTVYDGGTSVGRTAAFCQGAAPCPTSDVKRISVCASAFRAGGVPISACPPRTSLEPVDLSSIPFPSPVMLDTMKQSYSPGVCQGETLSYELTPPTDPCPHWQYYATGPRPRTEPQPGPGSEICTVCSLDPVASTLSIEIDSGFNARLDGGILKCGDETYSLDLTGMGAGDTAQIVTNATCATGDPVQLSFTVGGNTSATSPVLVVGPQTP